MVEIKIEELEKLSGKNILVPGASGIIGGAFVELLMSLDIPIDVYAAGRNVDRAKMRLKKYIKNPRFHLIPLDVVKNIVQNVDFDFIVDCAGGSSPNLYSEYPVEVMFSNIIGVKNLLEYGLSHNLKKFVYVSSGEVYGEGDGRIFTEDFSGYVNPLNSRSCYPMSKRASETLCVSYGKEYGIDVSIARPCHVYGPHFTESDNRVYAQFIRNVLNDEDIVLKSEGNQFRSWIYIEDCAVALLYILLKGENYQAYNVANEESNLTIKELAQIIADKAGKKVVFDIPNDDFKGNTTPIKKAVFSIEKLKSLGWQAQIGIEEGIKRTIEIMRGENKL